MPYVSYPSKIASVEGTTCLTTITGLTKFAECCINHATLGWGSFARTVNCYWRLLPILTNLPYKLCPSLREQVRPVVIMLKIRLTSKMPRK